jgi:exopolyphosphatase/guanosine-5'-triphosphate,3'-diphosphate pyrophosphatase
METLINRIRAKSGIHMEVINAREESRLGREAVFATLGPESQARCIADLGGGSLEVSVLRDHAVLQTAQIPVGTVRLMTTLHLHGAIRPAQAEQVRRVCALESKLSRPNLRMI